jgi:hypothetical protein
MHMITAAAAIVVVAASAASAPADGKGALERLKALAGEWQGTAESVGGPPAAARYEVGSGGTIVRELLFPGTDHEMMSVYHLVDGQLVVTHYCMLGNQPRMKLKAADGDDLVFDFDGGTNLVTEKDPHIHGGRIRLVAPDRMEQGWTVFVGGGPADEKKLFLTRKK